MAEMKVFVINLDEQEKDTGCAWFTLPCNIEALKQSIGLPPDSDRYLISDYDIKCQDRMYKKYYIKMYS